VKAALLIALAAGIAALGCNTDPVDPPYVGCSPACSAGQTCYRGFCVASSDPSGDAGSDVVSDAAADR
jgi:hypothetical protein